MPRKGLFSQPVHEPAEPQRRVLEVAAQPHRPGWYTLVWSEGGQVRRQHLSRERCLAGLAEVAGNQVLEELWGWRLAQLPVTDAPTTAEGDTPHDHDGEGPAGSERPPDDRLG